MIAANPVDQITAAAIQEAWTADTITADFGLFAEVALRGVEGQDCLVARAKGSGSLAICEATPRKEDETVEQYVNRLDQELEGLLKELKTVSTFRSPNAPN
jgi:hypothetical protein